MSGGTGEKGKKSPILRRKNVVSSAQNVDDPEYANTSEPTPGTSELQNPTGDPAPKDISITIDHEWDILTGFFRMTTKERDDIADDQIRTIKPEQEDVIRAAIIGSMKKTTFEATKALIKLMAYEGFSPIIIINELHRRQRAHNQARDLTMSWSLNFEGIIFEVTEKADLAVDVVFLTTLFLTRGNNVRKILVSIDKETKVALVKKINTYGIKNDTEDDAIRRKKNERIPLGSKDITLSRIAASFPHITLAVALNTGVMGKVEQTCLKLQYKIIYKIDGDIPAILTHGLIPALIPKGDQTKQLSLKFYCFMFNVEQSVTLQSPAGKRLIINEPMTKLLESAEKFVNVNVNAIRKSSAFLAKFLSQREKFNVLVHTFTHALHV